jgi:hypothetical protein
MTPLLVTVNQGCASEGSSRARLCPPSCPLPPVAKRDKERKRGRIGLLEEDGVARKWPPDPYSAMASLCLLRGGER